MFCQGRGHIQARMWKAEKNWIACVHVLSVAENHLHASCPINQEAVIIWLNSPYEWLKIISYHPTFIPIIFKGTELQAHNVPGLNWRPFIVSWHITQTPDGSSQTSRCCSSILPKTGVNVAKRPVDHLLDPVSQSETPEHRSITPPLALELFPPPPHIQVNGLLQQKRSKRRRKRAREVNNNLARLTVSSDISRLAALQFSFDYADQFHRRAEERNTWGSSSSARRETSLN